MTRLGCESSNDEPAGEVTSNPAKHVPRYRLAIYVLIAGAIALFHSAQEQRENLRLTCRAIANGQNLFKPPMRDKFVLGPPDTDLLGGLLRTAQACNQNGFASIGPEEISNTYARIWADNQPSGSN